MSPTKHYTHTPDTPGTLGTSSRKTNYKRGRRRCLVGHRWLYVSLKLGMKYLCLESPTSHKPVAQTNIAVREKELKQNAFVRDAIESVGDIWRERGRLLVLAAGFRHGPHESQQQLSTGEMLWKDELFRRLPTRHSGKKADGPGFVRSRSILTRLRYIGTVVYLHCK